ncbi:MAG: ABC transporter ATP-binding protein [Pseudomonadota bacterium]
MALISARNLHVGQRLAQVSLDLAPGELLGVIGPNGSGKSTLLNCLAGLVEVNEAMGGEIDFDGRSLRAIPPRQRARQIGLLPQAGDSAWSLTVGDVVALGRLPWGDEDAAAIRQAMDLAGVAALAGRRVDALSGGERARVWLARVLAGQPRLLLADEPIASLDLHYQCSVMAVLRQYAQAGNGVIVALHDLGLAARYCDSLCLLRQGRVASQGPARSVLTAPMLSEAFGVPIHVDLDATPPIVTPK